MTDQVWIAKLDAERIQGALTERATFVVEVGNQRACQNWAFQKFYELGNRQYRILSAVATDPGGQEHRLELPG